MVHLLQGHLPPSTANGLLLPPSAELCVLCTLVYPFYILPASIVSAPPRNASSRYNNYRHNQCFISEPFFSVSSRYSLSIISLTIYFSLRPTSPSPSSQAPFSLIFRLNNYAFVPSRLTESVLFNLCLLNFSSSASFCWWCCSYDCHYYFL